jgi:hypothetical protein
MHTNSCELDETKLRSRAHFIVYCIDISKLASELHPGISPIESRAGRQLSLLRFLWLSSVYPGKYRDNASNEAKSFLIRTSFQIHHSLIIKHTDAT